MHLSDNRRASRRDISRGCAHRGSAWFGSDRPRARQRESERPFLKVRACVYSSTLARVECLRSSFGCPHRPPSYVNALRQSVISSRSRSSPIEPIPRYAPIGIFKFHRATLFQLRRVCHGNGVDGGHASRSRSRKTTRDSW